jgi:hypothetical protein
MCLEESARGIVNFEKLSVLVEFVIQKHTLYQLISGLARSSLGPAHLCFRPCPTRDTLSSTCPILLKDIGPCPLIEVVLKSSDKVRNWCIWPIIRVLPVVIRLLPVLSFA